jgi:hypothetical protein
MIADVSYNSSFSFQLILYCLQYDRIEFQMLSLLITIHRKCSYNLQYDYITFPITIFSNRYYDIYNL